MNKLPNNLNPTHQGKDIQQSSESEPGTSGDRREFLVVTSKFSAVVATLGISSDVLAAKVVNPNNLANTNKGNSKSVSELLKYALKTGDMDVALKKYEGQVKLSKQQLKALRSLSRQDLRLLNSIKTKLSPLRGKISGGDRVLY